MELQDCKTTGLQDHITTGLPQDCRTTGLQDYSNTVLKDSRPE